MSIWKILHQEFKIALYRVQPRYQLNQMSLGYELTQESTVKHRVMVYTHVFVLWG